MKDWLRSNPGFIIITLIFLLTFLLMLPLRNVGYDDDFAYINTIENFIKTGSLHISEWAATTLIFQIYWALLFVKIFGFSIKILHLSNLTLFYISSLFFYSLLKRLRLSEARSIIFTLFLISFPYVFSLSYTYMSDIYYISLLIISLYFYIRSYQDHHWANYLFAGFFTALTFLERQIVIVLPISFTIVVIYKFLTTRRINFSQIIFTLSPIIAIYFLYNQWAKSAGFPVGYIVNVAEPFKIEFLDRIIPFNLKQIHATNSLYIEALAQKGTGYLNILMVFLLPIFLIFKIRVHTIIVLMRKNYFVIILTALALVLIYITDTIYQNKFSHTAISSITGYDRFLNWENLYTQLVRFSLPIWTIFFALALKELFLVFFTRRSHPLTKARKIIFFIMIILTTVFLSKAAVVNFPQTFSYHPQVFNDNFLVNIFHTIQFIFNSPDFYVFINKIWFFSITVFPLIIASISIFTHYKIKRLDSETSIILFITMSFFVSLFTVLFATHFFWGQYILQIFPFILIGLAIYFRNTKINYLRVVIIISLLLFFSLETTRYRYQIQGAMWEIGTMIVQTGVSPDRISTISWAWQPYWFFDDSFNEAVKNSSLNKYDVYKQGKMFWYRPIPQGENYRILTIPISQSISVKNNQTIVLESLPFWVFWQTYKVIAIKYHN